jgi:hypothetical protein
MPLQAPTSFTAGRKLTIMATTYWPGDAVPNAAVKGLSNLSSLLSGGYLVPDVPQRAGTNRGHKRTPTDATPGLRKAIP